MKPYGHADMGDSQYKKALAGHILLVYLRDHPGCHWRHSLFTMSLCLLHPLQGEKSVLSQFWLR